MASQAPINAWGRWRGCADGGGQPVVSCPGQQPGGDATHQARGRGLPHGAWLPGAWGGCPLLPPQRGDARRWAHQASAVACVHGIPRRRWRRCRLWMRRGDAALASRVRQPLLHRVQAARRVVDFGEGRIWSSRRPRNTLGTVPVPCQWVRLGRCCPSWRAEDTHGTVPVPCQWVGLGRFCPSW